MYITRNEIARLIAETPTDFILSNYRERWEGIRAIASYNIPLTTAQQAIVVSVNAHAKYLKSQCNVQHQNESYLPATLPDSTIKRNL